MATQKEKIQAAKRAYIMVLNSSSNGMTERLAVYLDDGKGLRVLWPEIDYNKKGAVKAVDLLPGQVYWGRNDNYPAYHFAYSGCGYSKKNEIRRTLQAINPEIEVLWINGWMVSGTF